MEPEKNEQLDRALKLVLDSLEQGKDFVIEQAPLVVQDLVAWGRITLTAGMVSSVVVPALLWFVWTRIYWALEDGDFGSNGGLPETRRGHLCVVVFVAAALATFIGIIAFLTNFSDCLAAWFVPRVYVLHELKGLLK